MLSMFLQLLVKNSETLFAPTLLISEAFLPWNVQYLTQLHGKTTEQCTFSVLENMEEGLRALPCFCTHKVTVQFKRHALGHNDHGKKSSMDINTSSP